MASITSSNLSADPSGQSATGRQPPIDAVATKTRTTGPLTGLTSGNPIFDRLLDRLHVAFGELARTDEPNSNAAADAADELSDVYTAMTGRMRPHADASAGALASAVRTGLASLPTALTDLRGQSMLRSL